MRDLSGTEALAMLSAVHRELGHSEADDPRLYVSYVRFMQALQREMPGVHQHVVKTWGESRFSGRSEPLRREEVVISDSATLESPRGNSQPITDPGLKQFIRAVQLEVGHEEGPGETGEPDEEDPESRESELEQGRGGAKEPEEDDPDEESWEEPERQAKEEDPDEGDDQEGTSEARELEPEEVDEAQETHAEETGQDDADSAAEDAPESVEADEPEPESVSGEARAGAEAVSEEETEWPAEEQPEPAERLEEFEGDESETPPLD